MSSPYVAKVGVFMPYYNMDEYINDALDSLYSQTFQDFTVIIADDASPSKAAKKILSKIDRPRLKVFFEEKNMGLIKISNKYMSKLNTEYIVLFNPDDKLDPDFLKAQVEYLDSHKDVQAVSTLVQEFEGGNRLLEYTDKLCELPYMLVENNFSGAALMRKEAWLAAGKHDTNPALYPNLDYDLWLSMLDKGFKLGIIQKPLFYWRVRQKSLSHSMDSERMLAFRKGLVKKYSHLYEKYSDYIIGYYLDELSKFENYYQISEEGHEWLDNQYKSLTAENALLRSELERSIQRPYIRSVAHKVKNLLKK